MYEKETKDVLVCSIFIQIVYFICFDMNWEFDCVPWLVYKELQVQTH